MIKFDSFKEYEAKQAIKNDKLNEMDSEQFKKDTEEIHAYTDHGSYVIRKFLEAIRGSEDEWVVNDLLNDALIAYRVGAAFWDDYNPTK